MPRQSVPVAPARNLSGIGLLVRRTLAKAWDHRIFGLSAEAGFWQLLSIAPLLVSVLGGIGYFAGLFGADAAQRIEQSVLRVAGKVVLPETVTAFVQPTVQQILDRGRLDIVSVTFLLSLWAGSTAMATFVNTITIAYGVRDQRSAVRSRLLALALYVAAVLVGIVMLPALVLGPGALVGLLSGATGPWAGRVVQAGYWPFVAAASVASLATLYHLSVPVRTLWRRALPGALLAMLLWLGGSFGLRAYVTTVFGHTLTYGSFGAPVAVLLFFYITAFAVLLGAELNAQIDRLWPVSDARPADRAVSLVE